jgi:hypothetical protein
MERLSIRRVWRALASVGSMQPLREKPGILILATKP